MSQQIVLTNTPVTAHAIYDQYAGLLYGYIFEVVKDQQMAEQYLLSVFSELPHHLQDILQPGVNIYHRLQLLARKILSTFFETIPNCPPADAVKANLPLRPNKFLDKMSDEQRLVFCNIHYSGKSIIAVAAEMNKGENDIKKILQQAFAVIRRAA